MTFKMSKLKMGIGKDKKKDNSKTFDPQFEKQLKTLLNEDINRDSANLITSPINSPTSPQISSPLSPARSLPSPLKSPNSVLSNASSDNALPEVLPNQVSLEKVEIENYYLTEQNKHFKRELLHCKLSVDALKKVVQTKDTLVSQLQTDKDTLEGRVKHLDKVLNWFKKNASQALLETCPYSPRHASTTSLTSSATSELEYSSANESGRRSMDSIGSKKGKEKRRSDSYNFVRDLFKFSSKSSPKQPRSSSIERSSEEWLNCEEEEEDSGLAENELLNLMPVVSETCNKPTIMIEDREALNGDKKSNVKFSSLRGLPQGNNEHSVSPKSVHSLNSLPSSSPKDHNSRAELRSRLFSPEINSGSPRALSPSSSSFSLPLPNVQKEENVNQESDELNLDLEAGLDLPDIDSELANLQPEDLDAEPYISFTREEANKFRNQIKEVESIDYEDQNSVLSIDIDSELAALTPEDMLGESYQNFDLNESKEDRYLNEEIDKQVNGNNHIKDLTAKNDIGESLASPLLMINGERMNKEEDEGNKKIDQSEQVINQMEEEVINKDILSESLLISNETNLTEIRDESQISETMEEEIIVDNDNFTTPGLDEVNQILPPKPTISLPPPPTEPPIVIRRITEKKIKNNDLEENLNEILTHTEKTQEKTQGKTPERKLKTKIRPLKKNEKNEKNEDEDDRPLSSFINKEQLLKLRTSTTLDPRRTSDLSDLDLKISRRISHQTLDNKRQSLPFPYNKKYSTELPSSNSNDKIPRIPHTQSHIVVPVRKKREKKEKTYNEYQTNRMQSEIDDDMGTDKLNEGFNKRSSVYKTNIATATHIIKKNTPVRKKSSRQRQMGQYNGSEIEAIVGNDESGVRMKGDKESEEKVRQVDLKLETSVVQKS